MNYTQKLAKARAKEKSRKEAPLFDFNWVTIDRGNCEIEPIQQVTARDIGHAMQKIVGNLPDDDREIACIEVWRPIE